MRQRLLISAAAFFALVGGPRFASAGQAPNGARLFEDRCASCHAAAADDPRVPSAAALGQRTPQAIVDALSSGAMRQQGATLTAAERRAVAEYITGGSLRPSTPPVTTGLCPGALSAGADSFLGPRWNGWSPGLTNTRFQPADQAGLTAERTPRLKLKWAFGFPNATSARALPTVAGARVFVGSQSGTVYSLDMASGCIRWTFQASASVRSAIVLGPRAGGGMTAYFGDGRSNVYAIDAATGRQFWSRKIEDHPSSHVTGAPALYQDRLYVPVASGEEGQGGNGKYECCTFRGSLVALNIATGAVAWKTYTIPNEPRTVGRNKSGTPRWGPSGAGIWGAPTIDVKRRVIYAATGNMYTEPQQSSSDAVIAFDLDTGKVVWTSQVTPVDVFVVGCGANPGPNCPDDVGPDFDFGQAPMIATIGGKDLIVIGQKSGVGWALDPDKRGEVVWQYRAGKGSALGGMEFGSALDGERVYFPVADGNQPTAGELHAVKLDTGERAWMAPPQAVKCGERARGCTPAILGAISVIPGVVFAGSQDGGIRAYSTKDGSIIWEYDTNRDFETVNGVAAKGASINGPGPIIAGGMLFINSGYGALGGRPGNVLLAFGVD
jgi:polyvinyl alcohol dehydrogenase (cytochrome)